MAVQNTMVKTIVVTSKHEDCNIMFTKPRKRGWNIPSKRDSKAQNKDQRSIVTTCTNTYCLVWVTKVALAAICLVFPALVLGYKSFNVLMYHVPVPT